MGRLWRAACVFAQLGGCWALLASLAIVADCGCAGTWDWTRCHEPQLRTTIAATDVALLAVDAGQSRYMVEHYHAPTASAPNGFHEINPVLGAYPTKTEVTLYCAAWAAAVVAGRIWLPRWASWAISGAVLAFEAETIAVDTSLGEVPTW